MTSSIFLFFICLILLQCLSSLASLEASTTLNLNFGNKKTYVVYMSDSHKPSIFPTIHDWYTSSLKSISTYSDTDFNPLLYAYTTAFNGFACILNPQQAQELQKSDSILGVYEDTLYKIHTTRTPYFLGLESLSGLWAGHSTQDFDKAINDVIIGVLDTGVWPESKSFDDAGMPEIPTRWKGECESWPDFPATLCNKKLIGARTFLKGLDTALFGKRKPESPRDTKGHGTHTASTAAGSHVQNASLFGFANGTARGVAPQARVATYKVCGDEGCLSSDILAGMDQAIQDGVDVLSLSLGGSNTPYFLDMIAVGAFAAVEKGIFVSCSAGNDGPDKETVSNVAPWLMTIGAGTLDRDFPAYAVLGNKKRLAGVSLYSGKGMGNELVSLVYKKGSNQTSGLCLTGSLDPNMVRGKVVLCDRGNNGRVEKGLVVKDAGGVGMILANTATTGEDLVADPHLIPTVSVGRKAGDQIREYVELDPNPTTVLSFDGTVLNVRPSPMVAAFSSRGPNTVTSQILKPDVIGPGVNILAAWPEVIVGSEVPQDPHKIPFNIISGTSMSCPHISGLAALLKAAHPEWSPSAIKSALMTTAYTHDNTEAQLHDVSNGILSTPWAHGAGHVNPQKAFSPGLVYDATPDDYIAFLCSLDYTLQNIQLIVKHPGSNCTKKFSDPGQLNYPSFSVVFGDKRVVRYTRRLTNVGEAGSVYEVTMDGPPTVGITVKPAKLLFGKLGERKRYTMTFVSKKSVNDVAKNEFGSIIWSNAQHTVRSPIAFTWTKL